MGIVAVSFVLSLIMCLLPFVAAAAIGTDFQIIRARRPRAVIGAGVWSMTSSFYDTIDGWCRPRMVSPGIYSQLAFHAS